MRSPENSGAPAAPGMTFWARWTLTVPWALTSCASGLGVSRSPQETSASASTNPSAPRRARKSALLRGEIDVEDRLIAVCNLDHLRLRDEPLRLEPHRVPATRQAYQEASIGAGAGVDPRLGDPERRRHRFATDGAHLSFQQGRRPSGRLLQDQFDRRLTLGRHRHDLLR